MISFRMPEVISQEFVEDEMSRIVQKGVHHTEWHVCSGKADQLIVCWKDSGGARHPVLLDDLLGRMAKQSTKGQILLNLQEPHLESSALNRVEYWNLQTQVNFTGKLTPSAFTLHERQRIHYPVEQCLPNYYQFETIKTSHLDVIHYFMNLHKVKTLRMHHQGLSESVIRWAIAHEIKLSIYGVETLKEGISLKDLGVHFVSITDYTAV